MRDRLDASPLPGWAVSLLADRSFHTVAAKLIVLTELFIAIGLWWRATRYAAVWVAVGFHVAIEVSASVEVFSYLAIAALVIWAVPSTRDRVVVIDPGNRRHRRLVPVVGALDWLARFRLVEGAAGAPVTLTDRDGTVSTGPPAVARVLSRLPLTAWFALPALLLPAVRRARRSRIPDLAGGPAGDERRRSARPRRQRATLTMARRAGPAVGRAWRSPPLALAGTAVAVFGVLSPPEHCPPVDAAELRASATETVDWFRRNQQPDGTWLYLYDADTDTAAAEYNVVRHMGAGMGLYQAASAGIPGALEVADRRYRMGARPADRA